VALGNPGRGEELFFGKGGCSSCHGVNGGGSRLYADLGSIGGQRSPVVLEDAMLDPQKDVRIGQRFYQVTDNNGTVTQGLLLNQDTHSVQLLNTDEKLQSFLKKDLSEFKFISTPMPSVRDVLSASEVADLVAYMISLKGE
jgi:putative heme-binding domain-containing protein